MLRDARDRADRPRGPGRRGGRGRRVATLEVVSRDGTRLRCAVAGSGPPVLLVHGGGRDHAAAWGPVLEQLARRFTVYALDRRGHGLSGDARRHALAREAEDVAAALASAEPGTAAVGHSFGALCLLEAAALGATARALVLYEGVPRNGRTHVSRPQLLRLRAACRLGAWRAIAPDQPGGRVLAREIGAFAGYRLEPARLGAIGAPALALVGERSGPDALADGEALAAALPHGRLRVLSGCGHDGVHEAPEAFVAAVTAFLEAERPAGQRT